MQNRCCFALCVRFECLGVLFEDIVFLYRNLRCGLHCAGCRCVVLTLSLWCVVVYGLSLCCFASCVGLLIFSYYTFVCSIVFRLSLKVLQYIMFFLCYMLVAGDLPWCDPFFSCCCNIRSVCLFVDYFISALCLI